MVALPLVLLGGHVGTAGSVGRSTSDAVSTPLVPHRPSGVETDSARQLRRIALAANRSSRATITGVAATTTVPVPVTEPPTTVPAPTTTTIAPLVLVPTTTSTPPATASATGVATWYAWNPGQCASPWLPKGTEVTVTDVATGASTSCLVTDREADNPGRVIDLDTAVFEQLAPLSAGAITVTISW